MIFRRDRALNAKKQGVNMWIYNNSEECPQAAVAYQETDKGHFEEFYHEKSAFIFYVIEGEGTWIIEDREVSVRTTDVIIVPPGKRFYSRGNLKQVCITAPAWEEKYEHHVRNVDL